MTEKFKSDYTNALASLACGAGKNGALLARKVITMGGMPDFAGDRVRLRTKLAAGGCLAKHNLPIELLAKLNKAGK